MALKRNATAWLSKKKCHPKTPSIQHQLHTRKSKILSEFGAEPDFKNLSQTETGVDPNSKSLEWSGLEVGKLRLHPALSYF